MRVIRIVDPETGASLDLHPKITVLQGVTGRWRERLIDAVAAIPAAREPASTGSIEVHGIILDLDRESLQLLELDSAVDVIVRAEDLPRLPTPDPPVEDEDPGLEVARRRVADLERRLHDAHERATREHQRLEDLERDRGVVIQKIERARSDVDSFAPAGLKVAREELAMLEARIATRRSSAEQSERHEIETRLSELITQADTLRRELRRLRALDPAPVGEALGRLVAVLEPQMLPSVAATDLAESIVAVDQQITQVRTRMAGVRQQLAELTTRRDAAHSELLAAERALRAPELDTATVEELERVHDEIFELDGRESVLGIGRARRRLSELRESESALLGRLGYDTWASYVMGVSSLDAESERVRRHDVARATYEFCEDELARAAAQPVDDAPELTGLVARREELIQRAGDLLGADPGDDPVASLRSIRVPAPATDGPEGAAEALSAALEVVGVERPSQPVEPADLRRLAEGWMETMSALPEHIVATDAHHRSIEREIDQLAVRLEALPPERVDVVDELAADPAIVVARGKVAAAELRVARHRAALNTIAGLEGRAEALDAQRSDIDVAISQAVAEVERAAQRLQDERDLRDTLEAAAVERRHDLEFRRAEELRSACRDGLRESLEWAVIARLGEARAISFVGSVPVLFDDAFREWPSEELADVLLRLERMSDVIQIVLVADDPAVAGWARHLGGERASVVGLDRVGS